MRRREFLRTTSAATGGTVAAGAAVGSGAIGTAAAQEERPDFGDWLGDVEGGYADARGESTVTVEVGASGNGGNYAFAPAGLWIDAGTTVAFEWTGEGGGHNVHAMSGAEFQSETVADPGVHFEHTFEEAGVVEYQCDPHIDLGMKGAVAVGEDVPTIEAAPAAEEHDPEEMGVPFQAHWVGVATVLGIVVSLAFSFFFLKYGETPHSGYPEED